jgi:hypothetical protein
MQILKVMFLHNTKYQHGVYAKINFRSYGDNWQNISDTNMKCGMTTEQEHTRT